MLWAAALGTAGPTFARSELVFDGALDRALVCARQQQWPPLQALFSAGLHIFQNGFSPCGIERGGAVKAKPPLAADEVPGLPNWLVLWPQWHHITRHVLGRVGIVLIAQQMVVGQQCVVRSLVCIAMVLPSLNAVAGHAGVHLCQRTSGAAGCRFGLVAEPTLIRGDEICTQGPRQFFARAPQLAM